MIVDKSQIERIIELLEQANKRKSMYSGNVTLETTYSFLSGFSIALKVLNVEIPFNATEQAHARRGWSWNALGPVKAMKKRGLTEEQMIDEIFALEIQAWKIVLETSGIYC